jgi:hypothetical protein
VCGWCFNFESNRLFRVDDDPAKKLNQQQPIL